MSPLHRPTTPRGPLARAPRAAAVAAAAALVLIAAGCGGEEGQGIPAKQAAGLIAQLDEVTRRVDARACNDVKRGTLKRIDNRLEALPGDVDPDVRTTIEDSVDHLNDLVEEECKPRPKPEPEPTPVPTTPAPTVPEQTQPEQTQPEEPQKEPKEEQPKQDGGNNNGGGGKGGGGGTGGGVAPGTGGLGVEGKAGKGKGKE